MERRIVIWGTPEHADLARDVLQAADAQVAAVVARSPDAATRLADALGDAPRAGDLREALADDFDLLWLAGTDVLTPDEMTLIRERKIPTLTCAPMLGAFGEVVADPDAAAAARVTPLMRRSPGYRAAMDSIEAFGEVQCVTVAMRSARPHGALYARLYDAMDIIEKLCGAADSIDAVLAPGPTPDALAGLRGHMAMTMRFADQRAASITVSDAAGGWFRGVTILGEAGALRIDDRGFEWISPEGEQIDGHRNEKAAGDLATLIGDHIRRVLDHVDAADPPPDAPRLVALCEAARLSSRTGQGESPVRMLEMLKRV